MKRLLIALCLLVAIPLAAWGQTGGQVWVTVTISGGILQLTSHPLTLEQIKGSALTRAEKDENWLAGLVFAVKADPEGAGTTDTITDIDLDDNAQIVQLTPALTSNTIIVQHTPGVIETCDGNNVVLDNRDVAHFINRDGVFVQTLGCGSGGGGGSQTRDFLLFGAGAAVNQIVTNCIQPSGPEQVGSFWAWGMRCPLSASSVMEWRIPAPRDWNPASDVSIQGYQLNTDSDPAGTYRWDVTVSCQGAEEGVSFSSAASLIFDYDDVGDGQNESEQASTGGISPAGTGGCDSDDMLTIRLTMNTGGTTTNDATEQINESFKLIYTTN